MKSEDKHVTRGAYGIVQSVNNYTIFMEYRPYIQIINRDIKMEAPLKLEVLGCSP
jgi:hypothetical protein